jgi:hypothetical protein
MSDNYLYSRVLLGLSAMRGREIDMKTINFATEVPEKDCLITIGDTGYWCDLYIILPDGLLLGSRNPKDKSLVILTKIDSSGLIFTEFNGDTTWDEFVEMHDEMIKEMEEYLQKEGGCSCGDPNCIGEGDESGGDDTVNPDFRTELTDLRDYI